MADTEIEELQLFARVDKWLKSRRHSLHTEGATVSHVQSMQGYLLKLTEAGPVKTWRKRWFVFTDGQLRYWRTDSEWQDREGLGDRVPFDPSRIERATNISGKSNCIVLNSPERTTVLCASDTATMERWIQSLSTTAAPIQRGLSFSEPLEVESTRDMFLVWRITEDSKKGANSPAYIMHPRLLCFTTQRVYEVDAEIDPNFRMRDNLNFREIRGLSIDNTNRSLLRVDLLYEKSPIFHCGRNETVKDLVSAFQAGSAAAKKKDAKTPDFYVRTARLFSAPEVVDVRFNKLLTSEAMKVFASGGVTEKDLWLGTARMFNIMSSIETVLQQDLEMSKEKALVVLFLLPQNGDFGDQAKKSFKVNRSLPIIQVVEMVCKRMGVSNPHRYVLASQSGLLLKEDSCLGLYGLGIFFETWCVRLQLRSETSPAVVSKDPPSSIVRPLYTVEFVLPPALSKICLIQRKTVKLHSDEPIYKVIDNISHKLRLPSSGMIDLKTTDGTILAPRSTLFDNGLGANAITSMKLFLHERTTPAPDYFEEDRLAEEAKQRELLQQQARQRRREQAEKEMLQLLKDAADAAAEAEQRRQQNVLFVESVIDDVIQRSFVEAAHREAVSVASYIVEYLQKEVDQVITAGEHHYNLHFVANIIDDIIDATERQARRRQAERIIKSLFNDFFDELWTAMRQHLPKLFLEKIVWDIVDDMFTRTERVQKMATLLSRLNRQAFDKIEILLLEITRDPHRLPGRDVATQTEEEEEEQNKLPDIPPPAPAPPPPSIILQAPSGEIVSKPHRLREGLMDQISRSIHHEEVVPDNTLDSQLKEKRSHLKSVSLRKLPPPNAQAEMVDSFLKSLNERYKKMIHDVDEDSDVEDLDEDEDGFE